MARVLLIGNGPLPESNPESLGFPQLRCSHFLQAMRGEHEVGLLLVQEGDEGLPEGVEACAVSPSSPDYVEQAQAFRDRFRPDLVVGGGPYEAARLAALLAGDCPLWVDIPGDPFAEAQAKAAHMGELGHTREMLGAYSGALRRADAFSVVSEAQRHALLGQLGLLGRLEKAPIDREWVHVLPVGLGFGDLEARAFKGSQEGELVVALCGGYNTWTDGENLLKALLLAMRKAPGLRVLSTGGAIPGHHSATYDAFKAQALSSPFADRFTFHGWVSHRALPELLDKAHVGICLDRKGTEPELGSRTRVLFYFHQGLEVIATAKSELCRELAGLRMLRPVGVGAAEELAKVLVEMTREATDGQAAFRAQRYLQSRYAPAEIFSCLCDWVNEPFRVDEGVDPSAELSEEVLRLRSELAMVYATPTWRAAGAADRLVKRGSKRLDEIFGKD